MNEKIENLMYQSGLTAQGCWDSMDSYDQQSILKFAQLIVIECVGIVENLPSGYNDYRNQIEDAFRKDSITKLKEHFGVQNDRLLDSSFANLQLD